MEKPITNDLPPSLSKGLDDLKMLLSVIAHAEELDRISTQLSNSINELRVERKAVGTIAEINLLRNDVREKFEAADVEAKKIIEHAKTNAETILNTADSTMKEVEVRLKAVESKTAALHEESKKFDERRSAFETASEAKTRELREREVALSSMEESARGVEKNLAKREADVEKKLKAIMSAAGS